LFYVTDLIGKGEIEVIYCPTDEMIADYNTKPLVGAKFTKFRDLIMNLSDKHHIIGQQECVGKQVYAHMKTPTYNGSEKSAMTDSKASNQVNQGQRK